MTLDVKQDTVQATVNPLISDIDLAPALHSDQPESEGSIDEKNSPESEKKTSYEEGGVKEVLDRDSQGEQELDTNRIIRTGRDVSEFLLSDRDDGDPSITFRGIILGLAGAAFASTMFQLYLFKPTQATISGSFLVVIIYTLGNLWAKLLPSSISLKARWGEKPLTRSKRILLTVAHFINPGPFGLKEHAVASITATSASNGAGALVPFAAQKLYYDVPLTAGNVIMSTLSIGLFGYGLTGLLRPIIIAPSEMVYWSNIPLVQLFQRMHWDNVTQSKPLRWFWYAFIFMTLYEFVPAYMFPLLVAFSIPCLASQNAPVGKQQLLTNIFGGSVANEGLGLFSVCFDWQYIQSFQTSLPLIQQANSWIGLFFCYIIFAALYYGNAFGARDLPFLSTSLWTEAGTKYPSTKVFINGVLDKTALAKYGPPRLTATYAFGMFVGNMSVGGLIAHVFFFWGPRILKNIKESRTKNFSDRHQRAMSKYPEVSYLWYVGILIFAFILGLVANIREGTTMPVWAYIIALLIGSVIAPFSAILYGMFGNGVNTNLLLKMIAGAAVPGRPLSNLYFGAWSHTAIAQALNLAGDLKMGTYLKIPPYTMLATQTLSVVFGSFINYSVMISVINNQRDVLLTNNGSGQWSGQYFSSVNTQATVWALSKELYNVGKPYVIVPIGLAIGFLAVCLHRLITHYKPKIGRLNLHDLNLPIIFQYSGWFAYNQTQSCIMLTTVVLGIFVQFYLRNYKPKIFKRYSYIVAAGLDGGTLLTIFILSFAVFGTAGPAKPFPTWAGNPSGYPDRCPDPSS
ncbi:hypothetical protein L7F22_042232 [Adiantum nelumboides]|nr:hypothetical protein [Adiantum nelumboides]